jgi:pumilio RNA-binding family
MSSGGNVVFSDSPLSTCHLRGEVRLLAHSPEGCRQVQDVLVEAASDRERAALMAEFRGRAVKAMCCPHANHVIQKGIQLLTVAPLQFLIDELLEERRPMFRTVATHRYGCRTIQHLLQDCHLPPVRRLAEAVIQHAVKLACHAFGNYSVQRLLEYGTADQKYRLVRTLERSMAAVGRSPQGGRVIGAALHHAAADDRIWIARAAVQDPTIFLHVARSRNGHVVVSQVLAVLQAPERDQASRLLGAGMKELRTSRHGRKVAACLSHVRARA